MPADDAAAVDADRHARSRRRARCSLPPRATRSAAARAGAVGGWRPSRLRCRPHSPPPPPFPASTAVDRTPPSPPGHANPPPQSPPSPATPRAEAPIPPAAKQRLKTLGDLCQRIQQHYARHSSGAADAGDPPAATPRRPMLSVDTLHAPLRASAGKPYQVNLKDRTLTGADGGEQLQSRPRGRRDHELNAAEEARLPPTFQSLASCCTVGSAAARPVARLHRTASFAVARAGGRGGGGGASPLLRRGRRRQPPPPPDLLLVAQGGPCGRRAVEPSALGAHPQRRHRPSGRFLPLPRRRRPPQGHASARGAHHHRCATPLPSHATHACACTDASARGAHHHRCATPLQSLAPLRMRTGARPHQRATHAFACPPQHA